jgi:hypothetical protein
MMQHAVGVKAAIKKPGPLRIPVQSGVKHISATAQIMTMSYCIHSLYVVTETSFPWCHYDYW